MNIDASGLVVKSAHNFYAGFVSIAAEVLHVASPGANTPDVTLVPYMHANLNQRPLVEDPFARWEASGAVSKLSLDHKLRGGVHTWDPKQEYWS
jgi:hypothetical protein